MSEQYYVGKKVGSLNQSPCLPPYSKVVIIAGEDDEGKQIVYKAGDNSGRTLEVTNPWGTQQIANDMLAQILGYRYRPFDAGDVMLPDTADIGDIVTMTDVYGPIIKQEITFDGLFTSNISAPNADETENEFGNYRSSTERAIARRFTGITTRLTVEVGKIESEIEDVERGLSSQITQTADALASEIINRDQAISTAIEQLAGSITLSASSSNGKSTFTISGDGISAQAANVELTVDHTKITGKLTADQIETSQLRIGSNIFMAPGATISWSDVDYPDDLAYTDDIPSDDYITQITEDTVSAMNITARYLKGRYVWLYDREDEVQGHIQITPSDKGDGALPYQALEIRSYGAFRLVADQGDIWLAPANTVGIGADAYIHGDLYPGSTGKALGSSDNPWEDLYIVNAPTQTSDREEKKDIAYDLERYGAFFDGLKPCSYRLKAGHGRTHFGLIAQDVEELIAGCGMTTQDVAAFIKAQNDDAKEGASKYHYALRYGELIPLMIQEIQQIKSQVKELQNGQN